MRVFKKLSFIFFMILFPIVCFSHVSYKPHLIFKVNSEKLVLDNTNIKSAEIVKNDDGSYGLDIKLTSDAAKKLASITAANIGKKMSLYYGDDKLISQATIQGSLGSDFQIAHISEKEAKALIDSLKNNQSQ